MAVPGVTIGRRDEGDDVTDGTVVVPMVTRAGVAWILRDAQAHGHARRRRVDPARYPGPIPPRARPTARA
jgi:hypothetical protein